MLTEHALMWRTNSMPLLARCPLYSFAVAHFLDTHSQLSSTHGTQVHFSSRQHYSHHEELQRCNNCSVACEHPMHCVALKYASLADMLLTDSNLTFPYGTPAPAASPAAAAAASTPSGDVYSSAASGLVSGSAYNTAVDNICEMGFAREEVSRP